MRETVAAKARRYLVEGRLLVERVDDDVIRALCHGTDDVYELEVDDTGERCSCPAHGRCTHLIAVGLVTGGPL